MVTPITFKELNEKLHNGVVDFQYKKKDGSIRNATGTLKSELINHTGCGGENIPKRYGYFTYFDLDANAFRCFHPDFIVGIVSC